MPNGICSECIVTKSLCTHTRQKKRRGPKIGSTRTSPLSQTQSVKTSVRKILSKSKVALPEDPNTMRVLMVQMASHIQYLERKLALADGPSKTTESAGPASNPDQQNSDSDSDQEEIGPDVNALTEDFEKLSVSVSLSQVYSRHFGESSNPMLLMMAIDIGRELGSNTNQSFLPEWQSVFEQRVKRHEYWTSPWLEPAVYSHYGFPPPDLLLQLVDLYFTCHATLFPLLHRPTFEKDLANGLHLRDRDFGNLVLAVIAMGSRYSDDPRVFVPNSNSVYSAGWSWFSQIQFDSGAVWDFTEPLSLQRLQTLCLSCYYVYPTTIGDAAWNFVGSGIRCAQERGAHRRDINNQKPTVEKELWRRTFWTFILFDTHLSAHTGRPMVTTPQDYDAEYLTECDDEYWINADTDKAFVQPEATLCRVSFYNYYIKLTEILGDVIRLLYPIRKPKVTEGVLKSKEKAVLDLDAALNKWIDSLPEHLKWDPNREDELFFRQSAMIHWEYYWIQIFIHAQFIPRPGKTSVLPFPSLAICANAARSCLHVVETYTKRSPELKGEMPTIIFHCALILLVNLWRGLKMGVNLDVQKEMIDIHKCVWIIRLWERRFQHAGRMCDMLNALVVVSGLSQTLGPSITRMPGPEVHRDPVTSATGSDLFPPSTCNREAPVEPSYRFDQPVALPFRSYELGELPVHGSFADIFTARPEEVQGTSYQNEYSSHMTNRTAETSEVELLNEDTRVLESRDGSSNRVSGTGDDWTAFETETDPFFAAIFLH
ncbi:hypothetical protein K435DRAFT_781503 [Dendrothele bispora CBS 962.96]|uniref:Xylanolytic transcriptional activator regulatory domain-containing protein n=1 Tax=Dendrothele bispora (strain CBS 962.96) TaxID=1314807 RepID=A0A4S8LKB6_DENBC|nr:hypothetical protein K435DRAFT_781503 [Dendrothele bispora CBS 962.96]